jgi:hypothetical protein
VAAPDFVPVDPSRPLRTYSSPPRRQRSWRADRPGDLPTGQPRGDRLGSIGPDQGYAYKLVDQLADRLQLGGIRRADAVAGCVAVALKRAALFGRAPVIHDLTAAFTLFGFLDDGPPAELVALRERLFPEVSSNHHYLERRELVDLVPDAVLARPHGVVADDYAADWKKNFDPAHLTGQ